MLPLSSSRPPETSATSSSTQLPPPCGPLALLPLEFDGYVGSFMPESGALPKCTNTDAHVRAVKTAIAQCVPTVFIKLWENAKSHDYQYYFWQLTNQQLTKVARSAGGVAKVIAFSSELLEKHDFRLELSRELRHDDESIPSAIPEGGIHPVDYMDFSVGYGDALADMNVLPADLNNIVMAYCAHTFEVGQHEEVVFEISNCRALRQLFEMNSRDNGYLANLKLKVLTEAYNKSYCIDEVRNLVRFGGSAIDRLKNFTMPCAESDSVEFEPEPVFNLSQIDLTEIDGFFDDGGDLSGIDMTYAKFPLMPNRKINFNFADLRFADFTLCGVGIFPPSHTLIGTVISESSLSHIPVHGGERGKLIADLKYRGAIILSDDINKEKQVVKTSARKKRKAPASSFADRRDQSRLRLALDQLRTGQ